MARRIPENIIEEIKQKSDIVDVVSSYVNLTKKSSQNLFGLCPFHQEKTPSFSVSPQKQIYYCFGCHKGGDAIHFIMDVEHMSYPEAIRFLGERVGVQVPENDDDNEQFREQKQKKERLYDLNVEAARYFYKSFLTENAREVRDYLTRRGISRQTATAFGLGYAPDQWQGLLDHLRNKHYTEEEIADSGLFKKNSKGAWYDLFRGRLIFPIIDVMGRIVAFGGRVLDDSIPKYLNSPETEIYTKGRHLYGLNLAKKTKSDRLIVVEGYMDCIQLHQAGFDQTVASLGTALTSQQAGLLRKYKEEIVLAYDMDTAGRLATLRNIDVLTDKGAKPYVLSLPDAKDPDDYIRKHGRSDFDALLTEVPSGLEYKFIYAKEQATRGDQLDKVYYQELASDLLLEIKNPVIQELYVPRVAKELEVPTESIHMLLSMRQQEVAGGSKPRRIYRPVAEDTPAQIEQKPREQNRETKPAFYLNQLEASFLLRISRRPDVFRELNLTVEPKWFHQQKVRPFVEGVLNLTSEGDSNDQKLMSLINDQEDDVRDSLASQFGNLMMQDELPETQDQIALIMRRQILLIRIDYTNALSDAITKRLDSGNMDDPAEWRGKFVRVRQELQRLQTELKDMDKAYRFSSENEDF